MFKMSCLPLVDFSFQYLMTFLLFSFHCIVLRGHLLEKTLNMDVFILKCVNQLKFFFFFSALCSSTGGLQGGAAPAFGSHHRFVRPLPRPGAKPGIFPGSWSVSPLHCSLPPATACHLRPAPPGYADPHRPLQSHLQEGKKKKPVCKHHPNTAPPLIDL